MHVAAFLLLITLSADTDHLKAVESRPAVVGETFSSGGTPTANNGPVTVPEPSAKAMEYYNSGNVLWIVSHVIALAIPCLVLFTGLSARMGNLARRIGRRWFFIILAYFVIYCLLDAVLHLPLSYYSGYVRQHAYGLSNQSFGKWLTDSLLGLAVRPGLRRPGGVAAVFVDSPQPAPLVALYGAAVAPGDVFRGVGRAYLGRPPVQSLRSHEGQALGGPDHRPGSKSGNRGQPGLRGEQERRHQRRERLRHRVPKHETDRALGYAAGQARRPAGPLCDGARDGPLCAASRRAGHPGGIRRHPFRTLFGLSAIRALLRRWKERFGFDQLSDVASLPLLLLLVQVISLVFMPVGLAFSRHFEHEADRFALEMTQDNQAAATAFVQLQRENLANPRPGVLFMLWRGSHPSMAQRIEFANDYRPWQRGEPLATACFSEVRRRIPAESPALYRRKRHRQKTEITAVHSPGGSRDGTADAGR